MYAAIGKTHLSKYKVKSIFLLKGYLSEASCHGFGQPEVP